MSKKLKKGVNFLSKKDLKTWNKLKQQRSRASRQIDSLNKKFKYGEIRGKRNKFRTQRTKAYQKLSAANRELNKFRNKHGIGEPIARAKKNKRQHTEDLITYLPSKYSFQFESDILVPAIQNKSFKKYILIYKETTIELLNTIPAFEIITSYDKLRNRVYKDLFTESDFLVNGIIDYAAKTLTIIFEQ